MINSVKKHPQNWRKYLPTTHPIRDEHPEYRRNLKKLNRKKQII
jgi:hypothetical protein